ncbi:MAG TPA: sigma-70 family RNA polymerase sigma factor [Chryseosolibacter sp.]|nr:sigma-70 family RNA polymerase sigma factor [Chryseosolibacter sp.]
MSACESKPDLTWQAFKRGSREAFEAIYRENIRDLLIYGYKVTSDKRLIEDSVQDLFVELWKNRAGLSDTTSIRFYLFKALRYKIVRNARIDSDRHLVESDSAGTFMEGSHESYLIGLEVQSDQMANLRELVAALPPRQQEAINLRYYHNFSNEEIARIMEVNYQSACKFIYSGLKNLKANLKISITSWLFAIFFLQQMD